MAYGRLDIYWPDGPIESYQLEKPTIAIGRSSGNDIVLDTTAVSRYHISLLRKDYQVFLEDLESVNGTYVDGERISPHAPMPLKGGEEIQLGDIRLIFQPTEVEEHPTQPFRPDREATRKIELTHPTFNVEVDAPTRTVTPGAHIQVLVNIKNLNTSSDRFQVEVDGMPRDWVRIDRAELELTPQEDASVIISLKPLRRSESKPGDYPVTFRVRARSNPLQTIEVPLQIQLLIYSGFGIVLSTPRVEAENPFELYVHNQGNGPLVLALSGASPGNGLAFEIQPPQVTLAPGERKAIHGYVRSKQRPIFGQLSERRFDVLAHSKDASGFLCAVEGMLVEKPALPLWAPTLILPLIVGLLLLAALVVGLVVATRPQTPVIQTFDVSAQKVFEGDPVTFSWTVNNAASLRLLAANNTPISIDPGANSANQVMQGVGEQIFTLMASNGDTTVQKQVTVIVNKALNINAFTVKPNPVLRYVRQDVTISWDVVGANGVRFEGIEALTGTPDNDTHAPSGQAVFSGTPRDTLSLMLIATGVDGKQHQQAVQIEIVNPICKAFADNTEVRAGPGTVYPLIKTLAADAQMSPDGRDQTGQWLHLAPSPDPQAWVAVNRVICNSFDPSALTLIASVPPTPPATATNTPTNTATTAPTLTSTRTPTIAPTNTPSSTPTTPPTRTPLPPTQPLPTQPLPTLPGIILQELR